MKFSSIPSMYSAKARTTVFSAKQRIKDSLRSLRMAQCRRILWNLSESRNKTGTLQSQGASLFLFCHVPGQLHGILSKLHTEVLLALLVGFEYIKEVGELPGQVAK